MSESTQQPPTANVAEARATVGQRAVIRRLLRHPPHEENFNIYPMMDMMTILLVFMIMQFARWLRDRSVRGATDPTPSRSSRRKRP